MLCVCIFVAIISIYWNLQIGKNKTRKKNEHKSKAASEMVVVKLDFSFASLCSQILLRN